MPHNYEKHSDISLQNMPAGGETQLKERRVLYCVPVPGETEWCRSLQQQNGAADHKPAMNHSRYFDTLFLFSFCSFVLLCFWSLFFYICISAFVSNLFPMALCPVLIQQCDDLDNCNLLSRGTSSSLFRPSLDRLHPLICVFMYN